jgi:hypothetical protein
LVAITNGGLIGVASTAEAEAIDCVTGLGAGTFDAPIFLRAYILVINSLSSSAGNFFVSP